MQNHFTLFNNTEKALCGQFITTLETSDIEKDITCPKCEKEYYNLLEQLESLEMDDRDDELPDYYETPFH